MNTVMLLYWQADIQRDKAYAARTMSPPAHEYVSLHYIKHIQQI